MRCGQKALNDIKAGGTVKGAYYFTLSDLPYYTGMSMYDCYRIDRIEVTLCPSFVSNVTKGTLGADAIQLPFLSTAIDHDDATTPSSLDNILVNATAVSHGPFNKSITRTFEPRVAMSAYQGAFTGYTNEGPNGSIRPPIS